MLILVGIVVSSLFQAFISAIKYVADPNDKLPAITFWLMGGLSSVSPNDVPKFILPIIIGSVPLILLRWKLNVLSFGEEEAQAMGVNTGVLRLVMITCSTLITAAAVSAGGLIGWVGLVIRY
jgi:iron complex transport system permease protein